jgi:hypothetical protein
MRLSLKVGQAHTQVMKTLAKYSHFKEKIYEIMRFNSS